MSGTQLPLVGAEGRPQTYFKWLGRYYRRPFYDLEIAGPTATWSANRWDKPGLWTQCRFGPGLAIYTVENLLAWPAPELWLVEPKPGLPILAHRDKLLVAEARLIRRVDEWNYDTAKRFADDVEEHAIPLLRERPDDVEPREAFVACAEFLAGSIKFDEFDYWCATWSRSWDIPWALEQGRDWPSAWRQEREWQLERLGHYVPEIAAALAEKKGATA